MFEFYTDIALQSSVWNGLRADLSHIKKTIQYLGENGYEKLEKSRALQKDTGIFDRSLSFADGMYGCSGIDTGCGKRNGRGWKYK